MGVGGMSEEVGRMANATGLSQVEPQSAQGLAPSGIDPLRFEWHEQTARFANGSNLRIAGVTVGSVFYDGVSSRAVQERYKIETRLPGLRPAPDRFNTEGEARSALEQFTRAWFSRLLRSDSGSHRNGENAEGG